MERRCSPIRHTPAQVAPQGEAAEAWDLGHRDCSRLNTTRAGEAPAPQPAEQAAWTMLEIGLLCADRQCQIRPVQRSHGQRHLEAAPVRQDHVSAPTQPLTVFNDNKAQVQV